ncbi:hypothetical protein [Streptomyces mirabilis]|uniref:hypothetical protein n=1 Tax=Streptomyces mirabilis TaxID=68239 RepID=UPI0036A5E6AC
MPPAPKLPDHLAYPLEIAPNNINNTRLKLKRLTARGILVETEQGLFTQPRP